jgi:hypothetical protein
VSYSFTRTDLTGRRYGKNGIYRIGTGAASARIIETAATPG